MQNKIFTFKIQPPKLARENFRLFYTGKESDHPKFDVRRDFLKFWSSSISLENRPSRFITLSELRKEQTIYYCVLIFVPSDELDAGGRLGLYNCNVVLCEDRETLLNFLVNSPNLNEFLPVLDTITENGLRDFNHLSSLLENSSTTMRKVKQSTLIKISQASDKKPVYISTYLDKNSIAITEYLAFYAWLRSKCPLFVSTCESKQRSLWSLSFIPFYLSNQLKDVIDSRERRCCINEQANSVLNFLYATL